MQFTRDDYTRRIVDLDGKIPEEEPVFLLRGQDQFAPATLRKYCDLLEEEAHLHNNEALMQMAQELREHVRQMLLWKYSKVPDCPKR